MRAFSKTENESFTDERRKLIVAVVLCALALFLVARAFIFPTSNNGRNNARPRTTPRASSPAATAVTPPSDVRNDPLVPPQPIRYAWPEASEMNIGRNIFAYYSPPANRSSGTNATNAPASETTPTPTPPPPLIIANLSPPSVYARTGEFTLEVFGDKFTPQTRININGSELPTRFISAQQLAATVPASFVSSEGPRQVTVRTPDGKLYSNTLVLNVSPPPAPPFNYIGLFGGKRYNDTALLQKRDNREVIKVQRGDVVGGRFRVTGISERSVELTDVQLGIKHVLNYVETRAAISEGTPVQPSFERFRRPRPQPVEQTPNDANDDDEKPDN